LPLFPREEVLVGGPQTLVISEIGRPTQPSMTSLHEVKSAQDEKASIAIHASVRIGLTMLPMRPNA
jgi:hypothetical protein